jgi:RNA polymerase sigma-70 factor (ECF subfamily)
MDDLADWLAESYPTAYRTACLILRRPADAEDAVQEAFLRVWRFRDAIPAGTGRRAWLYRVVVNASLSRLRAERPWRDRHVLEDEPPAAEPDPELEALVAGRSADVLAALAELPEMLRVPVVLRYYAGLDEREIATAIRRRPGTVKSRLFDARRRLAADPRVAGWQEVARA